MSAVVTRCPKEKVGAAMMQKQLLKGVLIDLSGTLHIENEAIPGAVEALEELRQKTKLPLRFITNTTTVPKRLLHERLLSMGFNIQLNEIFTALSAAHQYVKKEGLCPFLMLTDAAKEDFDGISTDNPNSVVIGLATSCFNNDTMNEAFRIIMNSGAPLIAVHKGRYYATKEGIQLGPGAIVSCLEYATNTTATILGKPSEAFFRSVLQDLSCSHKEVVMIGDDVRDDILGTQKLGITGILVGTGKYRKGDEDEIMLPSCCVKDFPAAVEWILENTSVRK